MSVRKWDTALCFIHGAHGIWAASGCLEGLTLSLMGCPLGMQGGGQAVPAPLAWRSFHEGHWGVSKQKETSWKGSGCGGGEHSADRQGHVLSAEWIFSEPLWNWSFVGQKSSIVRLTNTFKTQEVPTLTPSHPCPVFISAEGGESLPACPTSSFLLLLLLHWVQGGPMHRGGNLRNVLLLNFLPTE